MMEKLAQTTELAMRHGLTLQNKTEQLQLNEECMNDKLMAMEYKLK